MKLTCTFTATALLPFLLFRGADGLFESVKGHAHLRHRVYHEENKHRRLQATVPPTVEASILEDCVNPAEVFTLQLKVKGAGGTTTSSAPMDIVFAIDSSSSMYGAPAAAAKAAAKTFIDLMNPAQDKAGLVSWDSYIDFSEPLTNDFSFLKDRVDDVDANGGTYLDAGLRQAKSILDANTRTETSSQAIIFLTDGEGTYTSCSSTGPAKAIKDAGYVIYSIGLGGPDPVPLQDMASCTGGLYYDSPTAADLQSIYETIFQDVLESTIPHNVDMEVAMASEILPSSTTSFTNIDGGSGLAAGDEVLLTITATSDTAGPDVPVLDLSESKLSFTNANGNAQMEAFLSAQVDLPPSCGIQTAPPTDGGEDDEPPPTDRGDDDCTVTVLLTNLDDPTDKAVSEDGSTCLKVENNGDLKVYDVDGGKGDCHGDILFESDCRCDNRRRLTGGGGRRRCARNYEARLQNDAQFKVEAEGSGEKIWKTRRRVNNRSLTRGHDGLFAVVRNGCESDYIQVWEWTCENENECPKFTTKIWSQEMESDRCFA